jgi:hypothetical protein
VLAAIDVELVVAEVVSVLVKALMLTDDSVTRQ